MEKEKLYDTKWLIDVINSGKDPNYIFFWGHHARDDGQIAKSCFSQWWPSNFTVDGDLFVTAEHWMMAQKAALFSDIEIYNKIIETSDPKAVKELGRKVKNFEPNIWDQEKFEIVVNGNFHKFKQNEDLKEFLLSTDDRVIVEASPLDDIWGIGLKQDDKNARHPGLWQGPNLLGFAIMTARDLLRA